MCGGEIEASSRCIADITSPVARTAVEADADALAAAVEAARAGEHGRGFAVVASEVRALAQRSAEAARQIKVLTQDSAVKVRAGSALVGQSGATLHEIVESATRVTDLIAEIAAATRHQFAGVDQVNGAVAQMEQLTQGNAAQTEEITATSESLATQSERLRELVSRFTLSDGGTDIVLLAS